MPSYATEFVPFGPEVLANALTAGDQAQATVIRLVSGNFVVAWRGTDGSGDWGIKAQIFDSEGNRVSGEFTLNTTQVNAQHSPDLVALPNGGFAATWIAAGLNGNSVRTQVFDQNGGRTGSETIALSSGSNEFRSAPQITFLESERLVVSWEDSGGARARLFDLNGSQVGGTIQISNMFGLHQLHALPGGGFAVIREEPGLAGQGLDVVVHRFDSAGALTSQFLANSGTSGDQRDVDFAVSQSGQYFVVWTDANITGDGSGSSIKGQLFDAQGNRIGAEILVNETVAGNQAAPSVTALPSGGFVVSWADSSQLGGDASGSGVKAQAFDASGNRIGSEFLLNSTTAGDQTAPVLAETGFGRFAAVWVDGSGIGGDSSGTGVKVQVFSPSVLVGSAADDIFFVDDPADVVIERVGEGRDTVFASVSYILTPGSEVEALSASSQAATTAIDLAGNEFANTLYGNAGNNVLNGAGGADLMIGFGGNDTYGVDNAGDIAFEEVDGGHDTVFTSVSYALRPDTEVEVLSASDHAATVAIDLIGNQLDNSLYGNAGNNVLNGAGGADTLIGFGGNDTYGVDNAGDVVVEIAGGGYDTLFTSVSYILTPGTEVEALSTSNHAATNAIDLTGNEIANTLFGNAGNNVLNGAGGADVLIGFGGNDTYGVDNAGDVVIEATGGGYDTLFTSVSYILTPGTEVEALSTSNHAATNAINLTGNGIANTLFGNAGANILNGGGGNDVLLGFGGADTYAFTTALGAGNVDAIVGFSSVDDTIALDDAVFAGLAPGALSANAFVAGSAAADADDRILYDSATGRIFFDADGSGAGAAILFATVEPGTTITAGDFFVI